MSVRSLSVITFNKSHDQGKVLLPFVQPVEYKTLIIEPPVNNQPQDLNDMTVHSVPSSLVRAIHSYEKRIGAARSVSKEH